MPIRRSWSTHGRTNIVNVKPVSKPNSARMRKTSTTNPKMAANKVKQKKKKDPEAQRRERARQRFIKAARSVLAVIRFCNAMKSDQEDREKDKASSIHVGVRLQNTYQLGPHEEKKFRSYEAERIVEDILKDMMANYVYERSSAPKMARALTSTIIDSLKEHIKEHAPRYKLICNVLIGQNLGQGLHVSSRNVWDDRTDDFVSVHHKLDHCFAIATVHAAYTP